MYTSRVGHSGCKDSGSVGGHLRSRDVSKWALSRETAPENF